jgi:hypothetical protein
VDTVSKQAVFIPSGWWVTDADRERIAGRVVAYHSAMK